MLGCFVKWYLDCVNALFFHWHGGVSCAVNIMNVYHAISVFIACIGGSAHDSLVDILEGETISSEDGLYLLYLGGLAGLVTNCLSG